MKNDRPQKVASPILSIFVSLIFIVASIFIIDDHYDKLNESVISIAIFVVSILMIAIFLINIIYTIVKSCGNKQ